LQVFAIADSRNFPWSLVVIAKTTKTRQPLRADLKQNQKKTAGGEGFGYFSR